MRLTLSVFWYVEGELGLSSIQILSYLLCFNLVKAGSWKMGCLEGSIGPRFLNSWFSGLTISLLASLGRSVEFTAVRTVDCAFLASLVALTSLIGYRLGFFYSIRSLMKVRIRTSVNTDGCLISIRVALVVDLERLVYAFCSSVKFGTLRILFGCLIP